MAQVLVMTLEHTAQSIRDEFDFLDDWEDRYAHIIDLGKSNPPLSEGERTEDTKVRGCASQVWLVTDISPDGRMVVRAESDAMIVSGLISLLVRLFSGQRTSDILSFDISSFLEEIGVSGALTAQRSNGLASMIARIHSDASRSDQTVEI
ncbi:MAG: SufE family protein [Pseudomonadota bacterium]